MIVSYSKTIIRRVINVSSCLRFQNDTCNTSHGIRMISRFTRLPIVEEPKTYRTVGELKEDLRKKMGVEEGFQPLKKNRSHLLEKLPKSQADLPPRSMRDSFDSAIIPLSTNFSLQNQYINFLGNVRIGRLMEDMDIFAVNVVFKYLLNPLIKEGDVVPHVIATILVDEIIFSDFKTSPNKDVRISGHVSWTGKTSVEVSVWLEQFHNGNWYEITHAVFLMAARNSTNTGGTFLNKLVPADEIEKKILAEGEKRKATRVVEGKVSLLKLHPNPEEQHLLHELFLSSLNLTDVTMTSRVLPGGMQWMSDAKQDNIIFSHPEFRNMHNKVFGGFLMRIAAELAFMTVYIHSKTCCPKMRFCGGISFNLPVDVGSLVSMTGQVVYAEKNYVQVTVYATVLDPFTTKRTTSNIFYYTYECSEKVAEVVPNTYSEAMLYLDGRRHFQDSLELKM